MPAKSFAFNQSGRLVRRARRSSDGYATRSHASLAKRSDTDRVIPQNRRADARSLRTRAPRGGVRLKRAYERQTASDGTRVLVDRLWPRGLRKERLAVDFWLKDLAPSDALRRWYGHKPCRWASFAERYRAELSTREDLLHLLDELGRRGSVTLLYSARDGAHSNAVVLRDVLEQRHTRVNR